MYHAKHVYCCVPDVFDLMKLHDQDHAVGHIVDIRKQSDLEEYEEPEPQSNARTVTSFEVG